MAGQKARLPFSYVFHLLRSTKRFQPLNFLFKSFMFSMVEWSPLDMADGVHTDEPDQYRATPLLKCLSP